MTHPAALQATYSDFKLIKTRSVISLSFEAPIEHAGIVHDVLGIPVPGKEIGVGIARLNNDASIMREIEEKMKPSSKAPYGEYAAKLYKSYFMRNEKVCAALGTVEQFKAWIQKQESCISGKQDYIGMESGEMRCEESHVERVAAGHGKSIKAPYHSVPLTHDEHQLRHQKGEAFLFDRRHIMIGSPEMAKNWFDKKAMEYREKWVHERLLAELGYQHLNECPPTAIRAFAEEHDLTAFLPQE